MLISFALGVIFILVISLCAYFKCGSPDILGILMVYCRRTSWTSWLVWNVWGDDDWYLDILERRIDND